MAGASGPLRWSASQLVETKVESGIGNTPEAAVRTGGSAAAMIAQYDGRSDADIRENAWAAIVAAAIGIILDLHKYLTCCATLPQAQARRKPAA